MKFTRLHLFVVLLSTVLLSGCAAPLRQTLAPEARNTSLGREMIVTVAQNEINASIDTSNITAYSGGGLLFAAIDAGVNSYRAKKAEEAILDVRNALTDYMFDKKAQAASDELAHRVQWLGIKKSELNKDPGNSRFLNALNNSSAPEMLAITYDYLLDPAFDAIKVGANVSLLSKNIPDKGTAEDRILLKNALFTRGFVCVIPLAGADKDIKRNAALWAKDGGSVAAKSLDKALARLVVMMKRGLEFTPDQAKALDAVSYTTVGNYSGKLIDKDDEGTLLLSAIGQFLYVYQSGVAN